MKYTVDHDLKLIVFYGIHPLTVASKIVALCKKIAGKDWKEWYIHMGPEDPKNDGIQTGNEANMDRGISDGDKEERHLYGQPRAVGYKQTVTKETLA